MIDFDILNQCGSTNDRLREIATAYPPEDWRKIPVKDRDAKRKDIAKREEWEKEIMNRRDEGMSFALRNYTLYAAADLAWDSEPINKSKIPLLLYAQGKISMQQCANSCAALSCSDKFVKKDEKGNISGIDLPKFFDVSVNLIRSVITRRLAAQANKFNNLWPYFKYEARSTGIVAKLRADALSQRVDIIADQYDYRHHDVQCYRDMFLYAHCVDFVRASWEVEKQWEKEPIAPEFQDPTGRFPVRTVVVKEGLAWINPHPTRVFYDVSNPLASINSDSGCSYIGYWDVCRAGDVLNNPMYFNRDKVAWTGNLWAVYAAYTDYFNQYLDVVQPPPGVATYSDAGAINDRKANIGIYSSRNQDNSMFLTQYFKRMNPKAEGVGDYPFDVWTRFVVASDCTIVHAEFMPSTPSAYLGLNESDNRLVNLGFAHQLMAYQDQLTNLTSQMLLMIQSELLKIITINIDVVDKPEILSQIRKQLEGRDFATNPVILEVSLARLKELEIDTKDVVSLMETKVSGTITTIFQAMTQLIQMAERLEAMSPAEQGQPAPREISATETNEIAATTSSVYSFISDAIDEFRAAKKRIVYESLVSCSKSEIRVPVVNRYTRGVIEKAGFKYVPDEEEEFSDPERRRHTVIGSVRMLIHDYIFTSRDGSERAVNTQAANTLVQLLQYLVTVPVVLQGLGKEKLYEIINEIFRMSGAGVDVNLEVKAGEDNSLGVDPVEQLTQFVTELANSVKSNTEGLAQQEQINAEQQRQLALVNQLAQTVKKLAGDHEKMDAKVNEPPKEILNYKDVPDQVKRQMERDAGYNPATDNTNSSIPKKPAAE